MARMYSRRRGKAGSKKPVEKKNPEWVKYSAEEIQALILKFSKDTVPASQIGLMLRDTYGVPSVKALTGKSITQILKDNNAEGELPEDLLSLLKRVVFIKKHLEQNKQDQPAKRGLRLTESKVSRLVKYYKKSGRLAKDWSYDIDKIRFLTE